LGEPDIKGLIKPGNPAFPIFAKGVIIQVSITNKNVVSKIHPLAPMGYWIIVNYKENKVKTFPSIPAI
jgi:hypothetical protein